MNELRKAAEMALARLEHTIAYSNEEMAKIDEAKHALRQALAQPEQEPVGWMHNFIEGNVIAHKPADIDRHPDRWTALYKDSTPCKTCQALAMAVMTDQTYHEKVLPKREWLGLTDEEIEKIADSEWEEAFIRLIEAKLKEKNGG